ncbi:MAG: hypothetical protein R3C10_18355 [Pirellulales bacterium]
MTTDYRTFGTQFDCLPVVLDNGRVRINVRPRNSQIDVWPAMLVDGAVAPVLRVREIETGAELGTDETFVSTGLIEKRRVGDATEVIQLVVTVRVELPDVPRIARRAVSN